MRKPPRTTRDNVIGPLVTLRSIEIMPDGSGAPTVLECRGYVFALDQLGELTLRLIGNPADGDRTESKIARDLCTHAYMTLLEARVSEDWRRSNIRMYDE